MSLYLKKTELGYTSYSLYTSGAFVYTESYKNFIQKYDLPPTMEGLLTVLNKAIDVRSIMISDSLTTYLFNTRTITLLSKTNSLHIKKSNLPSIKDYRSYYFGTGVSMLPHWVTVYVIE